MKFKTKITLEISGESPIAKSLIAHFIIYLKDVLTLFVADFNDKEKIKITIKKGKHVL